MKIGLVFTATLWCIIPSALVQCLPVAGNTFLDVYTISATNITATFVAYGARLTSLLVRDSKGDTQDVVAGYDDPSAYFNDTVTVHTYFGAVVGRFANRIKNGTFTIDGVTTHVSENENGGVDPLHGGRIGYDARIWTVTSHSSNTITFTLYDDGFEKFPGSVLAVVTYTVSVDDSGFPRLTASNVAIALTERTPIMLSNHIYWNLNAWKKATILEDTYLHMPYTNRYIAMDTILVPTGDIYTVGSRPALDFTSPKLIGRDINSTLGVCGADCKGYDTAFIVDKPRTSSPYDSTIKVLSLWSSTTGIRLDVATNQGGLQIYSCNGLNGSIPVKPSQLARNKAGGSSEIVEYVEKYGCLVIETQQWIDGINHPEWGQLNGWEEFGPDTGPAVNWATFTFSHLN